MKLQEVIKLLIKGQTKSVDWYLEEDSQIAKKVSYNQGLKDLAELIEKYEQGEISKEYLDELERN